MLVPKSIASKIIEGFEVVKAKVTVSHLQFFDDFIFFCLSKEESFLILNHILALFEAMSSLKIHRGKS